MNLGKSIISNFIRGEDGGNSGNVVQIGDNHYIFDIFLFNGETKTGITYSSIEELSIIDDLRYFFSYGYILFNDSNDVIESFNGINGSESVIPYTFRGDGRDYLQVEIMPQMKDNDGCVNSVSEKDREEFCLKYTFSIYKIQEEMMEDRGVKYKKLFFWDVDYQLLNEIDSHFSTSEVPLEDVVSSGSANTQTNESSVLSNKDTKEKKIKNVDDFKRYTGDSIKYLLDKCFNKITTAGFKASSEWDKGGGLVEYHTNANYKAIDDLQYLLNYHVSEKSYDYVPCILKKTRYTEEYTLIPVTVYIQNTIFKPSGQSGGLLGSVTRGLAGFMGMGGGRNLTEDMYLGKLDTNGVDFGSMLNFGSLGSPDAFNAINYNIVENYSFLKADADIVQKDVSTHFVHSYDPNGFFTCSIKSNNFKSSTESIFKDNVKNLSNTPNSEVHDILPKNQLREEHKNVQHVYAAGLGVGQDFQKLNFGRNKALMASVFKNTAIYFRIKGLTRRRSGTFFNLNRSDNQLSNQHDKNILGKYFTTMVIHEFKQGMYYNHIYGTKSSSTEKQTYAGML
jgi:hypothetical protein